MILSFQSCKDLSSEPSEIEPLSILSTITTNTTKQTLYIYKTAYLGEGASYYYDDFFIDYAKVMIIDENSITYNFIPGETTYHKYKAYLSEDAPNFQAGKRYYLNIDINGKKISGETTFPGDFKIVSPSNSTLLDADKAIELNIKWTESSQAFGYIIIIKYHLIDQFSNEILKDEQDRTFINFDNEQQFVITCSLLSILFCGYNQAG